MNPESQASSNPHEGQARLWGKVGIGGEPTTEKQHKPTNHSLDNQKAAPKNQQLQKLSNQIQQNATKQNKQQIRPSQTYKQYKKYQKPHKKSPHTSSVNIPTQTNKERGHPRRPPPEPPPIQRPPPKPPPPRTQLPEPPLIKSNCPNQPAGTPNSPPRPTSRELPAFTGDRLVSPPRVARCTKGSFRAARRGAQARVSGKSGENRALNPTDHTNDGDTGINPPPGQSDNRVTLPTDDPNEADTPKDRMFGHDLEPNKEAGHMRIILTNVCRSFTHIQIRGQESSFH